MNDDRFKAFVTVYLLFINDGKVLLYRRINTGWQDGKYNFPGGHLEKGETILEAAIREGKEETGIEVSAKNLEFVHLSHRHPIDGRSQETNRDVIDIFFMVKDWEGNPIITEENKSNEMIWADLDNIPDDLLLFEKESLIQIKNKSMFSVFSD